MRKTYLMVIWFAGWNADIRAARKEYNLVRQSETDPALRKFLAKAWDDADNEEGKEPEEYIASAPALCRNKLHEMTPENTENVRRCIACKAKWKTRSSIREFGHSKRRKAA